MSSRRQMLEFLSLSGLPQPTNYSITYNITNGSVTDEERNQPNTEINPEEYVDGYNLILRPNDGYYIDSTAISVTGADFHLEATYYDDPVSPNGKYKCIILCLDNIISDVSINISFTSKTGATRYSITYNGTNSGATTGGVNWIYENEVTWGEVTYDYPEGINDFSIENATYEFNGNYTDVSDDTSYDIYLIYNATGNITITTSSEEEPTTTTISFTIDDEPYEAEEGMTWEDWCVSEYNTGEFEISDNYVKKGENYHIDGETPTDVIVDGAEYTLTPDWGSN